MPKPKRNTDFMTGSDGILSPLIQKYFERKPPPPSWGDEKGQWQRGYFLARVAANPTYLDRGDKAVPPNELQYFYSYFVIGYREDPDYFLSFLASIRAGLNVTTYAAQAKAFLREGAVDRFKASEDREPTDKELSTMIKRELGVNVPSEHFGDARRQAKAEDARVVPKLRSMSAPKP